MRQVVMRPIDDLDRVVVARSAGETIVYTPREIPWAVVGVLLTAEERESLRPAA